MVIANITDKWRASAAEWETGADEWETSADKWETSEDTWETSADEWDTNESASPFARRFQMFESLHIADHSYWFNV